MAIKFSNLASTTLASGVTSTATSLSVTSASLFPTLGSGDYFYASIGTGSGSEVVKVTAVSGTTFTVVRGQDDTTAISHSSGVEVALRVTAASLNDLSAQADTESVSRDGDSMTGNLSFGDNDKVILGAGSDLQIYHSGSHSVIEDSGTGNLFIKGTNLSLRDADGNDFITMVDGGSGGTVSLLHLGATKLATTSGGVSVTGSLDADGAELSGNLTLNYAYPRIKLSDSDSDSDYSIINDNGEFGIYDDTNNAFRLKIDTNGNLDVGAVTADGLEVEAATPVIEIDSTTAANLATLQFTTAGTVDSKITHQASSGDMVIESGRNSTWGGKIYLKTDTFTNALFTQTTSTFNENSNDIDFRVESNDSTHMLFVDGGNNRVGIGTGSPSRKAHITEPSGGTDGQLRLAYDATNYADYSYYSIDVAASNPFLIKTGGSERFHIASGGAATFNSDVGIGATPNTYSGYTTLTLGASSNGGIIDFERNGTVKGEIFTDATAFGFQTIQADDDIIFKGNDGGSTITALTLDMSNAGRANFSNDIGLNDGRALRLGSDDDGAIYNDGSNTYIKNATSNHDIIFQGNDDGSAITALTLDMSLGGTAIFNNNVGIGQTPTAFSNWRVLELKAGSAGAMLNYENSSSARVAALAYDEGSTQLRIQTMVDAPIKFEPNNAVALTLDGSQNATFNGTVETGGTLYIPQWIEHSGDSNTYFGFPSGDEFKVVTANIGRLHIKGSGSVWNEGGEDVDFRVESDSNSHMLFVDGGNNRVGIGTSNPNSIVDIRENATGGQARLRLFNADQTNSTAQSALLFMSPDLRANGVEIEAVKENADFSAAAGRDIAIAFKPVLNNAAIERFRIASDGAATFNSTIAAGAATFTTADNNAQLTLVSTDTDASVGPRLDLYRNSSSPANGDVIGEIQFQGEDTVGSLNIFATISSQADQVNNGAEDGSLRFKTLHNGTLAERITIAQNNHVIINETGVDADFRVESNNNTHALFVDAGGDKVGINNNAPATQLDVTGGMRSDYTYHNAAYAQTGSVNLNYWKIGRIGVSGPSSGELTMYGSRGSYSAGYPTAGKTVFQFRGSTNATVLDAVWHSEGQNGTKIPVMGYVPVGNHEFDIYAQLPSYCSLENIVSTGGGWTESFSNTGSSSAPTGFVNVAPQFNVLLGNYSNFLVNQSSVIVNEDSYDVDFRVESNSNTHMLFVDAGTNQVGIGASSPAADLHIKQIGDIDNGNSQGLMLESGAGSQKYILQTGRSGVSNAYFNLRDVTNTRDIFSVIDTNGKFQGHTPFEWNNSAVFNEGSQDYDFRVESDTNSNMLLVDASGGTVQVGHGNTGYAELDVQGDISIRGPSSFGTLEFRRGSASLVFARMGFDDPSQSNDTFVIDSSGNGNPMGFITNNDPFYFWVSGDTSNTADVRIENAGGMVINENGNDSDFRVETDTNTHAIFVDASANSVRFMKDSGSNTAAGVMWNHNDYLGITTTSTDTGDRLLLLNRQGGNGDVVEFRTVNVKRGDIEATSTGVTYNTTSDRRLKDNIETITDGTDKLMAMNPVTHGWKADPEADAVHGFIAQEMMDIVPEAVSGDPESDEMMSMDYGRITPVLVAALQDAHKKIAELETRLNELEAK